MWRSGAVLGESCEKDVKRVPQRYAHPFHFRGGFLLQGRFFVMFVVSMFMLIFGIAFGRPLGPVWEDFDVILGLF